MHLPQHFTEDDTKTVVAMVRSTAFGHLVVASPEGLASTPMPFVISDDGTRVRAHLARPNRIWKPAPCEALVIVPVSDAYVSPSWYPSKAEHGKVVPTWNYEVVHLHGQLVAHDDAEWTTNMVRELTDLHEAGMPTPWSVDDAPDGYIDQLVRGIVGIELEVSRIEAKRKLSQNKTEADRAGVIEGLAGSPTSRARTVGETMRP